MNEELKVTKSAVLAAAEKCPQAKEILKAIFPQAFESDGVAVPHFVLREDRGPLLIQSSAHGDKFVLGEQFKWCIATYCGTYYLVPTRK